MSNSAPEIKPSPLRNFCFRILRRFVVSLPVRLQEDLRRYYENETMEFCLGKLRQKGFDPRTVVDCGAYNGNWTRMVKRIFSGARVLMIEPQSDKAAYLKPLSEASGGSIEYIACLLGPQAQAAVTFYEMESGSSVLEELTNFPRTARTLPMRTLDDLLREKKMESVDFLKLDVQGFELEVLKGAQGALAKAEVVLLETSLVPYNKSAPLFDEVVHFMRERGFLAYDVCNVQRVGDHTAFQVDLFFAKAESPLRKVDFKVEGPR